MRALATPTLMIGLGLGVGCAVGAHADEIAAELDGPRGTVRRLAALTSGANANDAPRFVRTDSAVNAAARLGGERAEATEVSQRWWHSSGRADVGLGLATLADVLHHDAAAPPGDVCPEISVVASGTVLTLAMRYRLADTRTAVFGEAAGVRGLGMERRESIAGRVGAEFKAAQSRWNAAYGGLGLRFSSDTRLNLRLRKGGLGVTMRHAF